MNIHADHTSLNALLGVPNMQIVVPRYQRPYAWEGTQVDELWSDIVGSVDCGHFMGSLVLTGSEPLSPEVIDGQQRLSTLLLCLALIRDRFFELDPSSVGRIEQFLLNSYTDQPERRSKLRLGDANREVFRDFVLRSPSDPGRKPWGDVSKLDKTTRHRNGALIASVERLTAHIDAWLAGVDGTPQKVAALTRMETAIVRDLTFVVIKVPDVADAFVIFETLNDRGLALSAGDLLKNHLLASAARANDSVADLANAWDRLINSLNGADVTRFLRHYLLISHAKVRKDEVFGQFKKLVASGSPRASMAELIEYARIYGEFVDPSGVESPAVRAVLEDLGTLRAVMCYTALLPARRFLDADQFLEYARLAEILTFRFSSICGKVSNELETHYRKSAAILAESTGAELAAARQVLLDAMPRGPEFIAAFSYQAMGTRYLADYVLRRLEAALDPEEKSTRGSTSVHIEHIMPQTLTDAWRGVLGAREEEHGAYVHRWGNLTLLGGKKNNRASNLPFAEKKKHYRDSQIQLTRELVQKEGWTLDDIDARQREMGERADRIWPCE